MAYPMCAEITKKERSIMKHVKTLNTKRLQNTIKKGGCGECILPVCMQNILYSRKPELRAQIRFELVRPGMHSMVKIVHMSAGYAIMASYKMTV